MLVKEAIHAARIALASAGCTEAEEESRLMLCGLLGTGLPALRSRYEDSLGDGSLRKLNEWIRRRSMHEPLQYILGEWPFFGRSFIVTPDTLIPRPETEELCAHAIRLIRLHRYTEVLDLCCGTACIGITVRLETGASVDAGDIDEKALRIAAENANRLGAGIRFSRGDLFAPFQGRKFDLILINPPYLTRDEMRTLQPELVFEPALALYGGEDGMDFYRRIADSYRDHLHAGGTLLMEIGEKQGSEIGRLFRRCRILQDMNGKDRLCLVDGDA